MQVAIIGGGIGGMTLALSLHAAGIEDVAVYESASAIRELGVGINLLPHAVRELTELDLLDALLAVGIPTAEFVYYTNRGQQIWHEPLGLAAGYRWPQISIHRGELLGVLHRAVVERLGPGRIHPGHHLARLEQAEAGRVRGNLSIAPRELRLDSSRRTSSSGVTASTRPSAARVFPERVYPGGTVSRCGGA